MSLCGGCVRFGVEVAGAKTEVTGRSRVVESLERRATRAKPRDVFDQMEEELVPEYAKLVRDARVRKGLTPEQLDDRIKERRNTTAQLERAELHPSDTLVKKLENELGLKLMEKPDLVPTKPASKGQGGVTLGDLVKDATKKKP